MENVLDKSVRTLLISMHQSIEDYSDHEVRNLFNRQDLAYPLGTDFTEGEKQELNRANFSEEMKSALKKAMASVAAGVLFDFLNHLDQTTDPGD